jgi:predicted ABC-type ATPase
MELIMNIINQEIINQIQLRYNNTPLAVFLIGSNGSGKSTLRNYLNLSDIQTNIDPDALNRIYKEKYPQNYQLESAKQALKMYSYALDNDLNVCLESTLSGHGTVNRIIDAKKRGYYVIGYFVGLDCVDLNIKRIAMRVANGGHHIPDDIVVKRYVESITNIQKVKDSFDIIYFLDNSDTNYKIQFNYINGSYNMCAKTLAPWAYSLSLSLIRT